MAKEVTNKKEAEEGKELTPEEAFKKTQKEYAERLKKVEEARKAVKMPEEEKPEADNSALEAKEAEIKALTEKVSELTALNEENDKVIGNLQADLLAAQEEIASLKK